MPLNLPVKRYRGRNFEDALKEKYVYLHVCPNISQELNSYHIFRCTVQSVGDDTLFTVLRLDQMTVWQYTNKRVKISSPRVQYNKYYSFHF
jgi:hypothetical protein